MSSLMDTEYAVFLKQSSWYAHAQEGNAGEAAYLALGLAGEAGEFADEIKKVVRVSGFRNETVFDRMLHKKRKKLLLELGDPLWYFTRLCDFLGVPPSDIMILNTLKLFERMKGMDNRGELPITLPMWPFSEYSYDYAKEIWLQYFNEPVTDDE